MIAALAQPRGERNLSDQLRMWDMARAVLSLRGTFALAVLPVIAGCGQHGVTFMPPAPTPAAAADAASNGAVPIALPVTRLALQRVRTEAGGGAAAQPRSPPTYRVLPLPRESSQRFLVAPYSNFLSRNELTVTRVENTAVPTAVGNTFTDLTAARVQQIGGVIVQLARIAVTAGALRVRPTGQCAGAELPDFHVDLNTLAALNRSNVAVDDKGCFLMDIRRTDTGEPEGSITRQELSALIEANARRAAFWPVPACATVQLTVRRPDDQTAFSSEHRIAHPDRVLLYPLPRKGRLSLHPVCGADLTDAPTDRWQAVFDTLTEIDKQVTAVSKALNPPAASGGGG